MPLKDHDLREMPSPPRFRDLVGPSFILLGLGLGSGEIILWPYLTANFGLGIIWAAILGITLQFFINMEIERYSLLRGESIFVGFARKFRYAPFWFIFSTLSAFIWPGIIASSAKLVGAVFGIEHTNYIAVAMLLISGLILTAGPILYKTIEKFSILLIGFGVPAIFILVLYLAKSPDWLAIMRGVVGMGKLPNGDVYQFLPFGIPIASFLAAFAFSGAGGNLNLAQSFYIKEKGYGMGKYGGRITSVLTGNIEDIQLEGAKFEMSKENIGRFERWWQLINREHFLVFWLTGVIAISLLALLSYTTVFGHTTPAAGINFVLFEAKSIALTTFPFLGTLFLIIGGLMLFSTQTTVLDATSRIVSENVLIIKHHVWHPKNLSKIYYSVLWLQIIFGSIILFTKFNEPLFLLTLEAVINAGAMFVHIGATTLLNISVLESEVKPSLPRILVMVGSFIFFGFFTIKTLLQYI